MKSPAQAVSALYGNKVRVRTCGIYLTNNKILLVNHALYGRDFWAPPGGGIEFGETAAEGLKREFKEEAGLQVEVGEMIFINEFIQPPLHAVELFFRITAVQGQPLAGNDPEFSDSDQIIKEVKLMSLEEILFLPEMSVHALFQRLKSLDDIFNLKGII